MNLEKTIKKIESENPAVGIGAATAMAGILAASLVIKVANKSGLEEVKKEAYTVQKILRILIKEDMKVYKKYLKAHKAGNEEKEQEYLKRAVETPMKMLEQSYRIIELAEITMEKGKKSMMLEAYGAAAISKAAINSVYGVIDMNIKELKGDEYKKAINPRKYELRTKAKTKETHMYIKLGDYIFNK